MFHKQGQVLSTRADMLPHDFVTELSGPQDRVPPADPAEVWNAAHRGDGRPAGRGVQIVRPRADRRCIGRAGTPGVVGLRRASRGQCPAAGVRALVEHDLDILLRLARTLRAQTAWAQDDGVLEMAAGFAAALRRGTRIPHRGAQHRGGYGLAGDPHPGGVPVDSPGCWFWNDGTASTSATPTPCCRMRTGPRWRGLVRTLLRQLMIEGTFHTDPHPGNVLVLRDSRLALIDFGSV